MKLKKPIFLIISGFLSIILFYGCDTKTTPRPYGYHRISFPDKSYQKLDKPYPYTFEYPEYGIIKKDSSKMAEAYWINIMFPEYNGTIYLSYKSVNGDLAQYMEDARTLAYKHSVKAEAINEELIKQPENDVYGTLYKIEGDAASSLQFFLTDSSKHYIRGALYFRTQSNRDSLQPVIEFFQKDVRHIINSFSWNNNISS